MGPEGPEGPAGMGRILYVDSGDAPLGLVTSAMVPSNTTDGVVPSPAFYSEGTAVEAGWVVPSEPVTLYWTGTSCGSGTPYVAAPTGLKIGNVLYWTPDGFGNLYEAESAVPQDDVLIQAVQTPSGLDGTTCSHPTVYLDGMVELDPTPVDQYHVKLSFPWKAIPES